MHAESSPRRHIHWQSLERLLQPAAVRAAGMPGFDPEFGDIVDYIIKITHRIWEQKNVGLCYRHYSDPCPVHTLGSLTDGVEDVVQGTLKTLAAFPDRILIGENVVWSTHANGAYYSSHRITSTMTNTGWSEFGPPTGRTAKVTTIADCICESNRIVYEWLMRDNSWLLRQLGIDPLAAAQRLAGTPASQAFTAWWEREFARVRAEGGDGPAARPGGTEGGPERLAARWFESLFKRKLFGEISELYWPNARVAWPGGRHVVGLRAITGTFIQWLATVPGARATCDHVAVTAFDPHSTDVALRWMLAGDFDSRSGALAALRGLPALLLGATHLRIVDGRIAEEWTVFDEVAFFANLFRARGRNDG